MKKNNFPKSLLLSFPLFLNACSGMNFSPLPSQAPEPPQVLEQKEKIFELSGNSKTDILIITDNSGSMSEEQANMAQRMSHFLDQIKDLDWRLAVTTTDPDDLNWGDGNLLSMDALGTSYFYSSQQDQSKAQEIIGRTIQRTETGSAAEMGVFATYRALERARQGIAPNKDFFRDDANFVAIVLSDEDDSGRTYRSEPAELINYFKSEWPSKKFVFHSIITRPDDFACYSIPGHVSGRTYAELSNLTGVGGLGGAIIGSICAPDYGSQLKGMGKSIVEMHLSVDLDCEPVGEETSSVQILRNQSRFTEKYKVKGKQIVFTHPLPIGKYNFNYKCKKTE